MAKLSKQNFCNLKKNKEIVLLSSKEIKAKWLKEKCVSTKTSYA